MSDKKSENFNNLHAFAQRREETRYLRGKMKLQSKQQVTKSWDLAAPKQARSRFLERNNSWSYQT